MVKSQFLSLTIDGCIWLHQFTIIYQSHPIFLMVKSYFPQLHPNFLIVWGPLPVEQQQPDTPNDSLLQ